MMHPGEPVVGPKQRDLCWFCDKPASQTHHHTLKQGGKKKASSLWLGVGLRVTRKKKSRIFNLSLHKGYWARFSFYIGGEAESGTPSTSTEHESRGETKKKRANEIDRNRPERGRISKPVLCSALSDFPASCRSHYCANCACAERYVTFVRSALLM
ncbi:hypothetical protein BGZ61DRAFT_224026 [Ilyonectria robusta]|uniref:uncharacterized protein n=1 Tax=Ilyonectria robusta TaxID=1079257 RepID=UPI001E8EC17A|nr:uncharacterized protein BGZ61DRAFT_224026 [Ilyonectria robusta]KAH8706592.1 hypothetical protein BGZ61DRAFT_224026 [Ilyonectria robusta]